MKKFILFVLIITVFSDFANAQMTLTPYFRMDASNTFNTPQDDYRIIHINNYRFGPDAKLSYTYGVDVTYKFRPKWSLKIGLMSQGVGEKFTYFYFNTIGERVGLTSKTSYYYLNLPIQIQHTFREDKQFSPYVAFGAGLSFYMYNRVKTIHYNDNGNITGADVVKIVNQNILPEKINIITKIDYGFNWLLTEKIALNAFISGNITLLPTVENFYVNTRHFNIGVGIGINYAI